LITVSKNGKLFYSCFPAFRENPSFPSFQNWKIWEPLKTYSVNNANTYHILRLILEEDDVGLGLLEHHELEIKGKEITYSSKQGLMHQQ
jgi:hypothetical protein